jgi:hypothetical protein
MMMPALVWVAEHKGGIVAVARYLVDKVPDQVRIAFRHVAQVCKTTGINQVTLIVPQKGSWDRTIVAEFLGQRVAKALLKGQPVQLIDGVSMTLESAQTFRTTTHQGLLIGAHISVKDMNKLDDSWGAQAIVYLPWNDTEGKEWQATWRAEVIGVEREAVPRSSLSMPVEDALRRLTEIINLGTGLGHPSDKKHAERTIGQLRDDGHSFDPVEVRRWAQRNGLGGYCEQTRLTPQW